MSDTEGPNQSIHSHGVQTLIDRLHDDGVAQGKAEGERIVEEAGRRAKWIVQQAEEEARSIIENANKEANFIKVAGSDALEMAYRDVLISLKNNLLSEFTDRIQSVVSLALEDEHLLVSMILEITRNNAIKNQFVSGEANSKNIYSEDLTSECSVTVLLPKTVVGLDDLRKNPDQLGDTPLLSFIARETQNMLDSGIEIGVGDYHDSGIVVRNNGRGVELEFTDVALSRLLLQHLQPRFRALIEGIVG